MTDTPLDLDWERKARFHCRVRGISADEQVIDVVAKTIAPLLAEVETLRTQLAEARTENAEFVRELAKEANADGEWQYGYIGVENTFVRLDNDTAREALADPDDRKHILRRWISYGTPQAAEETTE